ncbi:MAG TPA: enolase C-terminal domain-like protein [Solirubrobacteraceae bacterium]|jgi:L-alanine-DL-glutamate epimerase-like enolase superfamily enzyme
MRITDVTVVMHDRRSPHLDVFGSPDGDLPMGVLRIHTDEGVEGNNFVSMPSAGPAEVAGQILKSFKPLLLGRDPLDIGAIWSQMTRMSRFVDPMAIGTVDVALWDIAGKVAGLPIHRLLGSYRDRVPAYFSSGHHHAPEHYADEALYWREQGWRGYKLHPPRAPWVQEEREPVENDIAQCAAVREAVGDSMALMLDSSWGYTYPEALKVGRAIEELDFIWYEDPLGVDDIYGYKELKRHLEIPILATEMTLGGLYTLPAWIVERATDFVRGDVAIKGGITGMMKIAHLAEAFHMNCEVHFGYSALNNVANLHVIMAIPNCEWFEVLAFTRAGDHDLEHLNYGLADPIEIDREGFAHVPDGPGLGVGIDWERINSASSGELR